jgi:hypothetical protein
VVPDSGHLISEIEQLTDDLRTCGEWTSELSRIIGAIVSLRPNGTRFGLGIRKESLTATGAIPRKDENQPRRNEEHEEKSEKTFVLFVSSWLIFRRSKDGAGG